MTISNDLTTLFVDHLTVIDFSYLCSQRGIVGESWIVDLQLTGKLDHQGMIFDFGHVKKQVKEVIDQLFDHRLLVPAHSPNLSFSQQPTDKTVQQHQLQFHFQRPDGAGGTIDHKAPPSALCELPIDTVTQASVKPFLLQQVQAILPANVAQVDLMLRQEQIDGPFYQYSHGLQHHDGDCQRIAHGHRSRLEIMIDQVRNPTLERTWCQAWHTIYLASHAHVIRQFSETVDGTEVEYLTIGYDAAQGRFDLTIPASITYIMDCDTTVELIANHIAHQIAAEHPQQSVTVKAYEGIHKGAIATIAP